MLIHHPKARGQHWPGGVGGVERGGPIEQPVPPQAPIGRAQNGGEFVWVLTWVHQLLPRPVEIGAQREGGQAGPAIAAFPILQPGAAG